jgi:hypothetical protein
VLDRVVGELHDTFIVTKQWNILEFDSKVIQSGLHLKDLCTTTTSGYIFGFGG